MAEDAAQAQDGHGQEGAHGHGRQEFGQAQAADVFVEVGHAQGAGQAAQVAVDRLPAGHLPEAVELFGGNARGQHLLPLTIPVQHDEDAVAGARQGARRIQNVLQHGVEVDALVDAQAGRAEAREAVPQRG